MLRITALTNLYLIFLPTRRSSDLQPVLALEVSIADDRDRQHEPERPRVAEAPVQLGHVPEVHAVDTGHQRRPQEDGAPRRDRKSTRLNSSHVSISYAVFCLKE